MASYKEKMIVAKEIYDKNNPKQKITVGKMTDEAKKKHQEMVAKQKYAKDLAREYFEKNKSNLIKETFEYFISCLETEKGKNEFEKIHHIKYENYPEELVGYYEKCFEVELVGLIKKHINNNTPDFCSFNVDSESNVKQTCFHLWVGIVMRIDN